MEANVQYNDFKGTAAADISDQFVNSMDEYLSFKSTKYDKNKYRCIGCELHPYGLNKLDAVFYCKDLTTRQIVPMRFNQEFSVSELCVMFKRMSIVIGENIAEVEDPAVDDIYLD